MDLDIMASVQEQIIGNCLCVLGDAMAMPIGSMIEKFRERVRGAHRGSARRSEPRGRSRPPPSRRPGGRASCRGPSPAHVTFSIDGREVDGAREHDARRRRQARRRRDPGLLLRAQARPAGRRVPHVPGRDRGHPEAADRLLDAGQGRHGRPHPDRARAATRRRRSSSSCSSTTRSTARSATRAASARCRTSPSAGAAGARASSSPSATSRSRSSFAADRDRPRALHPLLPLRALLAGGRRGLPAGPRTSAARTPTSARSTATRTSRRSAATSSSCARWAR